MEDLQKIEPLPDNGFHSFLSLGLDNTPDHVIIIRRDNGKTTASMTIPIDQWNSLTEDTQSQIHSVS